MAGLHTLVDDFATQDTAQWAYGGTAAATGGQLVLVCTSGYSNHVDSTVAYDLSGTGISVKVTSAPMAGDGSAETILMLSSGQGGGPNALLWSINANPLSVAVQMYINSAQSGPWFATYNPAVHTYLRIREANGTIFWDYSADRASWTNAYSMANPFAVTALYVRLGTGYYGTASGLVDAVFDDVNTGGSVLTSRSAPDAILAQTGLTGAVTAIQDDPNSPDGNWLVA